MLSCKYEIFLGARCIDFIFTEILLFTFNLYNSYWKDERHLRSNLSSSKNAQIAELLGNEFRCLQLASKASESIKYRELSGLRPEPRWGAQIAPQTPKSRFRRLRGGVTPWASLCWDTVRDQKSGGILLSDTYHKWGEKTFWKVRG